jgi:hypothetical protein
VLKDVRVLLDKPENWCQFAEATDDRGIPTGITSDNAKAFCLIGAFYRVCDSRDVRLDARDTLMQVNGIKTRLQSWNDNPYRTHKEVLGALDTAIQVMEKS